jgi:nucleotide sugar dehydrogenase
MEKNLAVLAVVGCGVVGSAVVEFYRTRGHRVIEQDPKLGKDAYHEIGEFCELAFVCVPTPTVDGGQDLTAVWEVMANLEAVKFRGVVVLKSTVLPGTCDLIKASYPDLRLVHNPEFLTAAHPLEDFADQPVALMSGRDAIAAIDLVYMPHGMPSYIAHDYRVTELAKYLHNTFLATKVAFMNQFYDVCQALEVPYDTVIDFAVTQEKIGENHTRVPGPDGSRGYGGACFPKDVKAFSSFALRSCAVVPTILNSVSQYNEKLRPE